MNRLHNILFIGCLYSENQKNIFLKNSKRGYQFAAQNFQEALLEGFLANGVEPYVLTVPSLSSFPFGYRMPVIRNSDFIYKSKKLGFSKGYLNIPLVKGLFCGSLYKKAMCWSGAVSGKKVVVVYGLLPSLMVIAVHLKMVYQDVKVCVVIPDLLQFVGCNKYSKILGLHQHNVNKVNALLPLFDCFVVLTESMLWSMGLQDKPFAVVEGIYAQEDSTMDCAKLENDKKIILYTGGLWKKYGIGDLLDAFMQIEGDEYRLCLCGTGDAVDDIKKCASKDSRIIYKGMLPKSDIVKLQKKATVLVNPRHSQEVFTQYSFPSKTMEYMASGTPVVMCRLKCLPQEYEKYLYFFEDESVEGMAKALKFICELDFNELRNKGTLAAQFVKSQKNAEKQAGKIIDLLASL